MDVPPGPKAMDCKGVFILKCHAEGSIDKYEARLVAKGFLLRKGIDFNKTYAPAAEMKGICLLLALCAHYGWKVDPRDVEIAFFNGIRDTP